MSIDTELTNVIKYIRGNLPIFKTAFSEYRMKSSYANSIIPGIISCGMYPYLDGINMTTNMEADSNMLDLLWYDRIDTFFSLQAEIDSNGNLISHYNYFRDYKFYPDVYKHISYIHVPINDGDSIDINTLKNIILRLCQLIKSGKRIYVHCTGGHGRTGMVMACLMKALYYNYDMVTYILPYIQYMHNSRRVNDKRLSGMIVRSPNTNTQIQTCIEFAKYINFLFNK